VLKSSSTSETACAAASAMEVSSQPICDETALISKTPSIERCHRSGLCPQLWSHEGPVVFFRAEDFICRHPDFEGTVEGSDGMRYRRPSRTPETRRSHVEQRVEAEPAEVIERVRRSAYPFYNGWPGGIRPVGKLPDRPLDHSFVRSIASLVESALGSYA
jgi:hypothetical protein